ncbi:MAG: hypothetical protein L6277_15565 [Desulfobacterales bacterium]|nr:hypothetical protein [Pseudomonadota bacterium]MBU4356390.1 hypothetical protein [Pseudomonadota bacterium]MCG2773492.1 hypothetical protein [Desulfobacterales bacterium]
MKFLRKIIDRLGIGVIEPNKSTFWYFIKNHFSLEKGSNLIASCFIFLFISGPLLFLLQILDFIKLTNEGNVFGCALIISVVMGIIYFISSEYRGYIIIREFINRSISPKPIKSYEDIINDMTGRMDEEYFLKAIEKKIKIIDAIKLIKKINKTEDIDLKP